MLQRSPSTDRQTPSPAPAIEQRAENESAVPTDRVQARADAVRRRRWDPITIGMLAGGLVLAAVGVAVAASHSYAHPAARAASLIWWGIYCGAFGASIGALPGLFTQRIRLAPGQRESAGRIGLGPRDSVDKGKARSRVPGAWVPYVREGRAAPAQLLPRRHSR
jgi:hypothetical protein